MVAVASGTSNAHAEQRPTAAGPTSFVGDTAAARLAAAARGFRMPSSGPALLSDRISNLPVDPADKKVWYVRGGLLHSLGRQ